jgi:ATP-dependent protease ClpP protease subunit
MPDRLRTARLRAELRQGRSDWYRITNAIGPADPTQIHIYGEIGYWGITASDFVRELSGLNVAAIDLHVSSPGGEIFDGFAIYEALRSHQAQVTTYIDGLAASIASVIAMAGDRIVIAPYGELMIHDGSGFCVGDAAEMRRMAELLDRQSNKIAQVYADRAGGTPEEWRQRMVDETWFSAAEAVEAGLADEIASTQTSADDNSPENLSGRPVTAHAEPIAAPPLVPVVTAQTAPESGQSEPAEEPAPELAPVETAPTVALAEPEPAAPIDDPTPAVTADDWASITAHLINPAPSPEDAFARLREALL